MTTIKNSLKALQPGLNALFGAAYKGLKPGMNVSELIAELGKIYLEYGNIPIQLRAKTSRWDLENASFDFDADTITLPPKKF